MGWMSGAHFLAGAVMGISLFTTASRPAHPGGKAARAGSWLLTSI